MSSPATSARPGTLAWAAIASHLPRPDCSPHPIQFSLTRDQVNLGKGLDWLKRHQDSTGAWRTVSPFKKRDPNTHIGKFMSDAAIAYAVLALTP